MRIYQIISQAVENNRIVSNQVVKVVDNMTAARKVCRDFNKTRKKDDPIFTYTWRYKPGMKTNAKWPALHGERMTAQ